jgi:hypothetical protein
LAEVAVAHRAGGGRATRASSRDGTALFGPP